MKDVAIYARVSTSDKDQDVNNQRLPLRSYSNDQGWQIYYEYVDEAPAGDLARRRAATIPMKRMQGDP